jgi:carbon monoxide dehydrogenase subunit G
MRLTNEVVLPAAPDKLFALLNDVERVVPCLPGATLEDRSGDAYQGRVRVKVGPISAAYHGTVRFLDVDEAAHRLVLDARGTDQHGSGNAEAKVEVRIRPHDEGSLLCLDTDLVVRGKVAQFGRGAISSVSQKLMEQFARNIGGLLTEAIGEPDEVRPKAQETAAVHRNPAPPEELDGLALVMPTIKRVVPVVAALVVGVAVGRLLGSRPRNVISDERVTATIRVGSESIPVSAQRIVSLLER